MTSALELISHFFYLAVCICGSTDRKKPLSKFKTHLKLSIDFSASAHLLPNNIFVVAGVDLTANQEEISDHETFQLEFDWSTKRWYIRTMQDKYWTLETGGGIQAAGDKR